MEVCGLLPLSTPKILPTNFDTTFSRKYSSIAPCYKLFDPCYGQFMPIRKNVFEKDCNFSIWKVPRMQVVEEEYELRQMKDMAAARKRWEALVREGKVKPLTPREVGYAIQLSGKTLLDVRPTSERNKAWVKGSTWIPIFDVDDRFDVGTLSTKATNFLMGGWWSGVPTLSYNSQFLSKVNEKFSKDTDLIVACQKGLRSLAACELLCNAGYQNVFWVQGGLESAEEEELPREGPQPFKFAGIGGLSEFLGWTDQQRVAAAKEGWQYRLVFSARMVGLFLAADALYLGTQQVFRYLQEIRTH